MLYAFVLLVGLAVGALVVAGLVHRPAARRWAETERGLRAEAETRNAELNALTRDAAGSSAQRQALEKELAELKAEHEREPAAPRRSPHSNNNNGWRSRIWPTKNSMRRAGSSSRATANRSNRC